MRRLYCKRILLLFKRNEDKKIVVISSFQLLFCNKNISNAVEVYMFNTCKIIIKICMKQIQLRLYLHIYIYVIYFCVVCTFHHVFKFMCMLRDQLLDINPECCNKRFHRLNKRKYVENVQYIFTHNTHIHV